MARAETVVASLVLVLGSTPAYLATLKGSPYGAATPRGLPYGAQAVDARAGATMYGERCAVCHGGDARGAIGPSLVTLWASGATDDRVLRTIRQGVPGSAMPPSKAPDEELRAIIEFLKTLAPSAAGEQPAAVRQPRPR